MSKDTIKNITTEEMIEELKRRGKKSKEISKFLHPYESDTKSDEEWDIKKHVTDILRDLGIPAHIRGYHYVRNAIILVVKNPEYLMAITKKLYPDIAKEFDTTPSRVERAIRHAVEVAWVRGDKGIWKEHFGATIKSQPTNSEFIAMISDNIMIK